MTDKKRRGTEKRRAEAFVGFRATPEEVAEIDAAADKTGLTRSAYIRAQSLSVPKTRATRRPTIEVRTLAETLAHLGKCGSNLNQIARKLNMGEHVLRENVAAAVAEVQAVAAQIVESIKR